MRVCCVRHAGGVLVLQGFVRGGLRCGRSGCKLFSCCRTAGRFLRKACLVVLVWWFENSRACTVLLKLWNLFGSVFYCQSGRRPMFWSGTRGGLMVSGVLFFGFSVLVNMRIPVSLCCESRSVFRKVFLWRVRFWLRMNAGGVLNTCKSNGIRPSLLGR